MLADRSAWILSDGAAGHRVQGMALAEALGCTPIQIHDLRAQGWRAFLAPQFAPAPALGDFRPALPTQGWPALAIGVGRIGAAALLALRKAGATHTKLVQILDPRVDPDGFDLVIAPAHDRVRGGGAIAIDGSLHAIDDAWIARQRLQYARLSRLHAPRCAVLLGGPRRGVRFDRKTWKLLADTLATWRARDGASAMLLASRRTPAAWRQRLAALAEPGDLLWLGEEGDNPYPGALAWAERFIVSAESVNMQCEALATGREVYSLCSGVPRGKLGRFHRAMVESGRLRPLRADARPWRYPPMRELSRILPAVREALGWCDGRP